MNGTYYTAMTHLECAQHLAMAAETINEYDVSMVGAVMSFNHFLDGMMLWENWQVKSFLRLFAEIFSEIIELRKEANDK